MAEGLFRHFLMQSNPQMDKWKVGSAGCWAYSKMPATPKAILAAGDFGVDLLLHESQAVSDDLLSQYSLILCMENGHVDFIKKHFNQSTEKTFLLSEMIDEIFEIDDPIGHTLEDYQKTAQQILAIIKSGFAQIQARSKDKPLP